MNTEENITTKKDETEENITTKKDETEENITTTEENTCGCTEENITTTEENTCGCTGEHVCTEEGTLVETDSDMIKDILKIFEDVNYAYTLDDIIAELGNLGYKNPGRVLTLALQDEVLYVDSIEDSGMVYLAISEQSEEEEE